MTQFFAWKLIPKKLLLKDREYELFIFSTMIAFLINMYTLNVPWQILVLLMLLWLHMVYRTIKEVQKDLIYIAATFIQFANENSTAQYEDIREMVVKDFEKIVDRRKEALGGIRNLFAGVIVAIIVLYIIIDFTLR